MCHPIYSVGRHGYVRRGRAWRSGSSWLSRLAPAADGDSPLTARLMGERGG